MKRTRLSGSDRDFFRLVQKAAFVNPFSDERLVLDRTIAGEEARHGGERAVYAAARQVTERIGRLDKAGKLDVRMYRGEDWELVSSACLHEVYHRYMNRMNDLILAQIEFGDRLCSVPFAGDALADMTARGFTEEEARGYFAVFFQLRRAYHFVQRALVGCSPSMKTLRRHLWNNIFTGSIRWYVDYLRDRMEDYATLLLGETGSGKGAAAASIGRSAFIPYDDKNRRFAESFTRNFISINLSQYPEALIESELFGHRKGAFTGAIEHHEGILARCSPHGAIFLDEIGDVSIPVQIKLLRVLEDREFSPVGGHEKIRFHGRIIAATNQDVAARRREGLFRDDFFYRLCSDCIQVPPLRQRIREDARELDDMLAHIFRRLLGKDVPPILAIVHEALRNDPGPDYAWPGNVRELEQAVRRILLGHPYEGDPRHGPGKGLDGFLESVREGCLTADEVLDAYCGFLYGRHGSFSEVARITELDRRTVKKRAERSGEVEEEV